MQNPKKILVTGAGGFIGKNLCSLLNKQNLNIVEHHSSHGDLREPKILEQYNSIGITDVIHLAGKSFVPDSWNHFNNFLEANVNATQNILEFCKNNRARMIFCSAYVYGSETKNPIVENAEIKPNNPYALSKKLAEDLCLFYSEFFEIKTIILRPFNVYGPGQRKEFLLPLILDQIKNGKEIRVRDLSPKRDYIFIEDLSNAFFAALNSEKTGIYNVASGKSTSVEELIHIAQKVAKTNWPVVSLNEIRLNEISDTVADISRIKKELNWEPQYDISQGIEKIISVG